MSCSLLKVEVILYNILIQNKKERERGIKEDRLTLAVNIAVT